MQLGRKLDLSAGSTPIGQLSEAWLILPAAFAGKPRSSRILLLL
jgi:hypothetical protein